MGIVPILSGQLHRGNPCYHLQGFPTELTPRVIRCCIIRILEECKMTQGDIPAGLFLHHTYGNLNTTENQSNKKKIRKPNQEILINKNGVYGMYGNHKVISCDYSEYNSDQMSGHGELKVLLEETSLRNAVAKRVFIHYFSF